MTSCNLSVYALAVVASIASVLEINSARASDAIPQNAKLLAQYRSNSPDGFVECGFLSGKSVRFEKVTYFAYFVYPDIPTRLWLFVTSNSDKPEAAHNDVVLGENDFCKTNLLRTTKIGP